MGSDSSKVIVRTNLENLKDAMKQGNLPDLASQIHQELDLLEGTTVDVAVTGVSGAGKSSFVNAVRGMADSEEGAAATGVKQTTMEPKAYQHPTFPNVTVWDLPGIGTHEFKANEYLKKINFGRYDFFIIVAAERFFENDEMLAREIQRLKKHFYFVRTKVDSSLEAERRKPDFSEEKTLQEIREYCCENLTKAGESAPRIFLISSWHLDKYDFPVLQVTLLNDLNEMKRHALILALPSFSKEILQKKKAAMEDIIWRQAIVSACVEAFPVPHTPLLCNFLIVIKTLRHFYKVFGLDDDSLHRLAKWVGKPVEVLRSAIQKSPVPSEITEEFTISLLCEFLALHMTVDAVISYLEPSMVDLPDGGQCFKTLFFLLKFFLNDIVEDAGNVWAKAAEH
ncbi:PREDICTED: interferon-inducible GTPase 5-like [Gekko japonicus]|uniref:Interferon-inducible GTPase 5-like n=1 Tax=Gekko japonicus TaxID=146911 RepID=A0ABM1KBX1_GEKJA|nr:PREDICTED: interferon-inducible GTPase 5-like [Gekko japonicus]